MTKPTFQACVIFLLLFSFNNLVNAEDYLKEEGIGDVFSCGGLKLSDHGMRMDRQAYFYNESTRKVVCVTAMGANSCAVQAKDKPCICPPPEWEANGCWQKYGDLLKVKDIEYRKSYDEFTKKLQKQP